jgi:hypothetical protein
MSSATMFVEPLVIASGGALTSTNVGTSLDPAAYDVAHTYASGDQATSGESIYQSLVGGNTGNAVTDTTKWVRVGAINRMKMFDQKVGSQTLNADTIEVVVTPGQAIDVVALRNLDGFFATVEQSTVADGVIYSKTVDLDTPVLDWFDYWFSPITRTTEALFTGLLPYSDATTTVTVDNTGGTAKCGELLMGLALTPGNTESGVQDGIDDYSVIAPDQFGVRDIIERDYADNMSLTVWVDSLRSPVLKRFLTLNRAKPILVIASASRPDAQVYGLAESWQRTLSYPGTDVYTITMRGLT